MFGIDLWRIILCAVLIYIVVRRANLVASFAKQSYAKRDYEKSLKIFRVANKIGNLNSSNRLLYAYVLLRLGYVEESQLELRRLLPYTKPETADRYQVKNLLALGYWKQGNLAEAIEEMEEITAGNYKNTMIYQNLGILYNLSNDKEKALNFNLEAFDYNSDDNIITDNLADAYAINGDFEKAAEVYKELINRTPEPHFPEAYYGYGKVLIRLGEKQEGIKMIEKSLTKPFSFLSIRTKDEIEKLLEDGRTEIKNDNNI